MKQIKIYYLYTPTATGSHLVPPTEIPTKTNVLSSASLSQTMQPETITLEVASHLLFSSTKLSSPRSQGNGSLVESAHFACSRVASSKDSNHDRHLTRHVEIIPVLEGRKPFLPRLCTLAHESILPNPPPPPVPLHRRNENTTQLAQPLTVNDKTPDTIYYALQGKQPIKTVVVPTNGHNVDDDDISSIGSDSDSECFFLASPSDLRSMVSKNTVHP